MKSRLAVYVVAISVACAFNCPILAQDWKTKYYHSMENGNELYSECQSAVENIKHQNGKTLLRTSAEPDSIFEAGNCRGYIKGVVDSIPTGEGFEPDEDVTLSQHVEVVLAYLRNNPSQRHLPAYTLARTALTEAFPAKRTKR